jgi:hypothetical protein
MSFRSRETSTESTASDGRRLGGKPDPSRGATGRNLPNAPTDEADVPVHSLEGQEIAEPTDRLHVAAYRAGREVGRLEVASPRLCLRSEPPCDTEV